MKDPAKSDISPLPGLPTRTSFTALIVAGGLGRRLPGACPKQFLMLGNKPVLQWSLETFDSLEACDALVLVLPQDWIDAGREILKEFHTAKPFTIVAGGKRRQDSVAAGLAVIPEPGGWVAIHDGARPLIPPEVVQEAFDTARMLGNAVVAIPAVDTLVMAQDTQVIGEVDRTMVYRVQTPQIFPIAQLVRALEIADLDGYTATDDAGLVRRLGTAVYLTTGSSRNLKLTTAEDLAILQALLKLEPGAASEDPAERSSNP